MWSCHQATIKYAKVREAKASKAESCVARLTMSKACAQCVDITINGKRARVLVYNGVEAKTAATRLGLRYSPTNIQLKMVNAPPTPVDGVAHGVSIDKRLARKNHVRRRSLRYL